MACLDLRPQGQRLVLTVRGDWGESVQSTLEPTTALQIAAAILGFLAKPAAVEEPAPAVAPVSPAGTGRWEHLEVDGDEAA